MATRESLEGGEPTASERPFGSPPERVAEEVSIAPAVEPLTPALGGVAILAVARWLCW